MEVKERFKPNPEYWLMDQVLEALRSYHYSHITEPDSHRTEPAHPVWIFRFFI